MSTTPTMHRIYEHARGQPNQPAFIENDGVPVNYGAFVRMIELVRHRLAAERLPIGALAAAVADTYLELWVITLALRTLGLDTISVSDHRMLDSLQVKGVACIAAAQKSEARIAAGSLRSGTKLISIPQQLLIPRGPDAAITAADIGSGPGGGCVILTSGTTGTLKKLLIDVRKPEHARARTEWGIAASSYDKNSVLQALHFPLWTAMGAGAIPLVFVAGGCVIMNTKPDRLSSYFRHSPTIGLLTPDMLTELLAAQPVSAPRQENFSLYIGGGTPPLALAQSIVQRITRNVYIAYASSEATAMLRSKFETPDDLYWLSEHMSRYEIVNEDGEICPAGIEGEIRVPLRDFDCRGYLDDAEATANSFRDGCFYPGDLAVRRGDGRIRILGRAEDVLNVGGWKVPTAPIEDEIARRVGATAVCLFGERDGSGTDRVVIAIETERAPHESEIRPILSNRKGFEHWRIAVLKSFPRTEAGMRKVNRRALRRMLD